MSHGTRENTGMIYAHIVKTKQGEEAKFVFSENKEESEGNYIEGYITDITLSSYEYKGDTIPTYILQMVDGTDRIKLDTSWTSIARTILNALCSMDLYGKVRIQIKPAGSKDEYNSVFVNVDEAQALKWRYKNDDTKDMIIPAGADENPGKFANFDKLDKFYQDLIEEKIGPYMRENYAEAQKSGLIPKSDTVVPAEDEGALEKAVEESSTLGKSIRAEDIDVSSELPSEKSREQDVPSIEEESDDLPF